MAYKRKYGKKKKYAKRYTKKYAKKYAKKYSKRRRTTGYGKTTTGYSPEKKYIQNMLLNEQLCRNQVGFLMNGIGQGSGVSQRIGNRMRMTEIDLRYSVHLASPNVALEGVEQRYGITTTPTRCRIMLVYDPEWNKDAGTTALMSKYCENAISANEYTLATYNNARQGKFKILYDKIHTLVRPSQIPYIAGTLEYAAANATNASCYYKKLSIKCNLPVQYADSGELSTSIQTGALYLFYIADTGAVAGDATALGNLRKQPYFVFDTTWRVRYLDA